MSNIILQKYKPVHSEEYIDINSSFWAHYGYFKNDFSFDRPSNCWRNWIQRPFVAPQTNYFLKDPYDKGVEFICCEHVSVCVNGNADYILNGTDNTITYDWTLGVHNVENGLGYLPNNGFTRVFHNNFELCCIIQKPDRPANLTYNFQVLNSNQILDGDVEFLHVAAGSVTVDGTEYAQKQTAFNLTSGANVTFAVNSIGIVGYTV